MDCKRTVIMPRLPSRFLNTPSPFCTTPACLSPAHPCPFPLDSRFRAPCRKGYRRVMRQMDRATTRPKIVLRAFGARLAGNVKLDPAFLKKLPGQ